MMNIKDAVKYAIISNSNYHKQGDKKNIYLFSIPRSGSTWLMEAMASQPGFKYYDEPFNIRRDNVLRTKMFTDWEFTMPGNNNEQLIIEYLKHIELNHIKVLNPPPFRRNYRFITNRIIFKIHELEHLINIVKERLNGKIIYLTRHPISITISRNVYPRLEYFVKSDFIANNYLTREQIKYIEDLYKKGDHFEKGILSWCYQSLIPLKILDNNDWVIVSYEELLLNPRKMCNMLVDTLDLEDTSKMMKSFNLPAANINLSSKETINIMHDHDELRRNKSLVTKWQQKVTNEQIDKAFEILAVFGIDVYSKDSVIAHEKYLHFNDTASSFI